MPHDAVGLCYLSTGCRIAHHKIIGEQGVRACTPRRDDVERDRERQEPSNEVPFLRSRSDHSLTPRTVELIKAVSGTKNPRRAVIPLGGGRGCWTRGSPFLVLR